MPSCGHRRQPDRLLWPCYCYPAIGDQRGEDRPPSAGAAGVFYADTIDHVLLECAAYVNVRQRFMDDVVSLSTSIGTTPEPGSGRPCPPPSLDP